MNNKLREKAVKLRVERELSYSAIRKRLGVPKSTLSYWLHDYPLSEEKILELRRKGWKKGEAARERYRNTMRQKKDKEDAVVYKKYLKTFNNLLDETLFATGIMLYIAEGSKKRKYGISLANTDPSIIQFFFYWCIKFFNIDRKDIKVQLHLYENMDIEKETKFWQNTLSLTTKQLYKTQVRKLKTSSFSYRESYRHGTCSVYVSGGQISREVRMASKAIMNQINTRV